MLLYRIYTIIATAMLFSGLSWFRSREAAPPPKEPTEQEKWEARQHIAAELLQQAGYAIGDMVDPKDSLLNDHEKKQPGWKIAKCQMAESKEGQIPTVLLEATGLETVFITMKLSDLQKNIATIERPSFRPAQADIRTEEDAKRKAA